MRWSRRRRTLVDLWADRVAAAGPLHGDLVAAVVGELAVMDGVAEVEALNAAILDSALSDKAKNVEELSGL